MYMLSGLSRASLLLVSMNLGHIWSHDVCPCVLQFVHQNFVLSSSEHSAVRCSLPQVLQAVGLLHSAVRWLAPLTWHFRHLLGSFFIFLAYLHLPAMISPSLMVWFATSGDRSLIMRWAVHWPTALLITSLIHLVDTINLGKSPNSCSIFLFSPSTSGLWAMGSYSAMTDVILFLLLLIH